MSRIAYTQKNQPSIKPKWLYFDEEKTQSSSGKFFCQIRMPHSSIRNPSMYIGDCNDCEALLHALTEQVAAGDSYWWFRV